MRARHVAEISGGQAVANLGDLANTALLSLFIASLMAHRFLLALIPVLAALRGSVMTSMASRTSTGLFLGSLEPSVRGILAVELWRTTALAVFSAVYASLLVSLTAGYPARLTVPTGVISSVLALLVLAPATAWLAAVGYRRRLNPDNFLAPVLTVLGDVSTVPSLVAAGILVTADPRLEPLLYAGLVYLASLTAWASLLSAGQRRVFLEGTAALLLVGLIESGTGGLYAGLAPRLLALGVIHMVPSLMEDVGASLSVFASRLTSMMHLYGSRDALARSPGVAIEVVLGSLPSMLILSGIGYATAGLAGLSPSLLYLVRVVAGLWLLLLALLSPVALGIAWASFRLGLDPDNLVIPLVTSIVDLSVPPALVVVASTLG